MTASIASLSALDSSTRARLWLLRLSRLPMADHARVGTLAYSSMWDLLCDGKPYLAKFLWRVHTTTVPHVEEEDSEDVEDAT